MSMKKKSNKQADKNGDVVYHTFDEFLKLALSFIPYGVIADSFLNYQGNLKRRRAIEFSERLKKVLEEFAGRELHANDFSNEDFVDVMEEVYKKVLTTSSKHKLERFRNILAKQIIEPIESHETLKFVHILGELQDVDLVILQKMKDNDSIAYKSNFAQLLTGSEEILDDDYPVALNAGGNDIEITVGDIEFYVNRLTSLGLLKLHSVQMTSSSRQKRSQVKNYQTLLISKMGKKFLNFIELKLSKEQ